MTMRKYKFYGSPYRNKILGAVYNSERDERVPSYTCAQSECTLYYHTFRTDLKFCVISARIKCRLRIDTDRCGNIAMAATACIKSVLVEILNVFLVSLAIGDSFSKTHSILTTRDI